MAVRTIVFDFGNVLGFFSHRRAAEQLAALGPKSVTVNDLVQYLFYTDLEPRLEVAGVTAAALLQQLRDTFRLAGDDETLGRAYADMFTPNDPVCQLVPRLKKKYRLALLSNTNELHYRQFGRQFADTLAHFDRLFLSHEVRLRKPDPKLYQHVEQRMETPPGECLFIDDLPVNIAAAQARGWHGVLYQPGDDLAAKLGQAGVVVS